MIIIKFLLLIFTTFFLLATPVFADTQSELISRVNSDTETSNALMKKLEAVGTDSEAALGVFSSEISSVINHFEESKVFYLSKIESADTDELKNILKSLSLTVTGLSDSLKAAENAINNGDVNLFDRATSDYDGSVGKMNSSLHFLRVLFGHFLGRLFRLVGI